MDKQNNYVEDITERYIYQVSKHLNTNSRKDIEAELRALISDMCERRSEGSPTSKDIHEVLKELGSPYELADKYSDKTHYLIGPEIFSTYLLVLRIVLAAVLFGMTVVTILDLLIKKDLIWYEYLGTFAGNMIGGIFMAFAWVTLVFAIIEWRGVNLKELVPDFNITDLPPVPRNETVIPIWEPIFGVIFSIFGTIVLVLAPQLLGVYYFDDGLKTIPVFNLEVFRTVLPMFIIMMILGISKHIWEIFERRYSIKYAVFTFIANTINAILTVIIFTRFPIWNIYFIPGINSLFPTTGEIPLNTVWEQFTSKLVIVLVIIYVLDIASILYKALKHSK